MSLMALIEVLYGLRDIALRPVSGGVNDHTYIVQLPAGPPYVLRVYHPNIDPLMPHEQVLLFLAQQEYPAPRVVHTLSGDSLAVSETQILLLTTFVEGAAVDYSPSTLFKLGETVGRLHATPVSNVDLPRAGMLPSREVAWAAGWLRRIADQVPAPRQDRLNQLLAMLHSIPDCEDLPVVLIHNDCHPGNALITPADEVVLIDWDGAGLGPAVLDVGFLLASCDTRAPWNMPLPPDPARVNAVVDGYCRHHLLTPEELDRLADAIRFRSTIFGAAIFASHIEQNQPLPQPEWWEARYLASDEIAHRARRCFDLYR